jgi:hypothetical protein
MKPNNISLCAVVDDKIQKFRGLLNFGKLIFSANYSKASGAISFIDKAGYLLFIYPRV